MTTIALVYHQTNQVVGLTGKMMPEDLFRANKDDYRVKRRPVLTKTHFFQRAWYTKFDRIYVQTKDGWRSYTAQTLPGFYGYIRPLPLPPALKPLKVAVIAPDLSHVMSVTTHLSVQELLKTSPQDPRLKCERVDTLDKNWLYHFEKIFVYETAAWKEYLPSTLPKHYRSLRSLSHQQLQERRQTQAVLSGAEKLLRIWS